MKIDNILLDKLTAQAQESPRLRMNLDLRNSSADSSQRMLNAIEPGSVVPVHRHRSTSETVVVLSGRVVEVGYYIKRSHPLGCQCFGWDAYKKGDDWKFPYNHLLSRKYMQSILRCSHKHIIYVPQYVCNMMRLSRLFRSEHAYTPSL